MARLKNLSRNSPGQIISDIWSRRAFLSLLGYSRVKASLAETNAAGLWWLLEPALQAVLYIAVFGLILPASSRPDHFVVSLVVGVSLFQAYQSASTRGTSLFNESRGLMENASITPWAFVVSAIIEIQIKSLAFIVIVYFMTLSLVGPPTWWWLAFPLVFLWSSFFLFATCLVSASLSRKFASFPRVLSAFNRLVFYSSGIFWSLEKVLAESPLILAVAQLNPLYQLILMGRATLVGAVINWPEVAILSVISAVVLVSLGIATFAQTIRNDNV